jgi:hypothetical protein
MTTSDKPPRRTTKSAKTAKTAKGADAPDAALIQARPDPKPVVETGRIKDVSVTVTSRHREDRHASIALAAYFRSQSRGFAPGHEVEDWLAAEEEVDQRLLGEGRAS